MQNPGLKRSVFGSTITVRIKRFNSATDGGAVMVFLARERGSGRSTVDQINTVPGAYHY